MQTRRYTKRRRPVEMIRQLAAKKRAANKIVAAEARAANRNENLICLAGGIIAAGAYALMLL